MRRCSADQPLDLYLSLASLRRHSNSLHHSLFSSFLFLSFMHPNPPIHRTRLDADGEVLHGSREIVWRGVRGPRGGPHQPQPHDHRYYH